MSDNLRKLTIKCTYLAAFLAELQVVALEVAGFLLRLVAPGGQLRHKRDADAANEDPRDQVAIPLPSAAHAGNLNLSMVEGVSAHFHLAFLVADTQLYKRLCPSVRWSVGSGHRV